MPRELLAQVPILSTATLLEVAGTYLADVFDSAHTLYGGFEELNQIHALLVEGGGMHGVIGNNPAYTGMIFDVSTCSLSRTKKQRANGRLGINGTETKNLHYNNAVLGFALGHELGHCIQHNTSFADVFGEIDPTEVRVEDSGRSAYLESEVEVHADFIGAKVLKATGWFRNEFGSSELVGDKSWRTWAKQYPIALAPDQELPTQTAEQWLAGVKRIWLGRWMLRDEAEAFLSGY